MPSFFLNKLVRDKLPTFYSNLNQKVTTKKLSDIEFLIALREKLIEESQELQFETGTKENIVSELSDVLQVIDDIKQSMSLSDAELNSAKAEKFEEKGGFLKRTYINTITLKDDDKYWTEYYRNEPDKYKEVVDDIKDVGKKNMGEQPELELGKYQHYKGGMYDVLELACNTETLEWYVVYQSKERKEQNLPSIWVRPYSMFIERVEVDGESKPRFKKIKN